MDELDIEIIKTLQNNGREKHSKLARKLGLAQSTLLERVNRLESQGLIQGYHAIIDPEKVGLAVQAFIAVTLKRHESEIIRQFEENIQKIVYIRSCYHLAGQFDYILHVAARDLKQLGQLVKTQISALPGFGTSETFAIFSEIKSDAGWSIENTISSNLVKRSKKRQHNK